MMVTIKQSRFLVIIPCEKVTANLEKTLLSVQRQTYKWWKVIVVLTLSTKEKIRSVTFVVEPKTKGNPSVKRNYALKYKNCDYVLFLDDDVVLDKYFLENARHVLKQKEVSAVVGPQLTPPNSTFLQKVSGRILECGLTSLRYSPQKDRAKEDVSVKDYSCAAMVVRLVDFKKIGGFSEQFFPGEDTKLCLDITAKLNKKIIRSDTVIVYHRRRPFPFGFLKQISRYGFQRGRFSVLFPKTSLHLIYCLPFLFTVYGIGFLLLLFLRFEVSWWFWSPFLLYLFFLTNEVAIVYRREKRLGLALLVGVGIVLTHMIYGVQFGRGLISTFKIPLFMKEGVRGSSLKQGTPPNLPFFKGEED